MKVYRDGDADLADLGDAPVAVLGYGNQGRAHALNLRDAGASVIVGQREPGAGFERARRGGFQPVPLHEAVQRGGLVVLALPDDAMPEIYRRSVARHLRRGQTLGFIHGFNIHFGFIAPPADVDVVMVAPKGPGDLLRDRYAAGGGLAALIAVEQDASGRARRTALAWARGIGCTRVGAIETSFARETVTDLFGEQTVLCGGVVELMKAAFDTLVDAGYPAELAYFECVHEVKQVVDLIYAGGLAEMRRRISSTARYGGLVRGPEMVPGAVRQRMRAALEDISSGEFARRFVADREAGGPELRRLADAEAAHAMEAARRRLADALEGLTGMPKKNA